MALCGLWKQVDSDYAEKLIFELSYVQHGGSGLTWTRSDILNMSFDDAHKAIEALRERRSEEARAMRRRPAMKR